jgi:hypothetical protein
MLFEHETEHKLELKFQIQQIHRYIQYVLLFRFLKVFFSKKEHFRLKCIFYFNSFSQIFSFSPFPNFLFDIFGAHTRKKAERPKPVHAVQTRRFLCRNC